MNETIELQEQLEHMTFLFNEAKDVGLSQKRKIVQLAEQNANLLKQLEALKAEHSKLSASYASLANTVMVPKDYFGLQAENEELKMKAQMSLNFMNVAIEQRDAFAADLSTAKAENERLRDDNVVLRKVINTMLIEVRNIANEALSTNKAAAQQGEAK